MATETPPKKIRWLKRLSYVIAGGTAMGAAGMWFAHSAHMQRVYIRTIASAVKNEMGLDFDAAGLGFSLIGSRVGLYRPSLDVDFFAADEIEVVVDLWSLLGNAPRVRKVRIVNPTSNISAARIDRIKTKQSGSTTANWRIDALEVRGGRIFMREPEWGLPSLEVAFDVDATGGAPRKLDAAFDCSKIVIANEDVVLRGSSDFTVGIDADVVSLKGLNFDSDLLKLNASGMLSAKNDVIMCEANGAIFSQRLAEYFGDIFLGFNGQVDFHASVSSKNSNLTWNINADALNMTTPYSLADNCNLMLDAKGDFSGIEIEQLTLTSKGASLALRGHIKDNGCKLMLDGTTVPLKYFSTTAKTPLLDSVVANVSGHFLSPLPIWSIEALPQFKMDLVTIFNRNGNTVGGFSMISNDGLLQIKSFELDIPDLKIYANAVIGYEIYTNKTGVLSFDLASMDVSADAATTAERVAHSLERWGIADSLPVSGEAYTKARISWSPSAGLSLLGSLKLENPVYFGATADVLDTDLKVYSEQLFLENLRLDRKDARAWGHLWLTWGDVPAGTDQVAMHFESSALPLSEGLEASISDQGMLANMDPKGRVDGWVTIKGPFDAMTLVGEAKLVDGSIYGVSIPAFAASVEMNLAASDPHLKIPEFRLADSPANLDSLIGGLALKGELDIDLANKTWVGQMAGTVDSLALGMFGAPRVTAHVESTLGGSIAARYGTLALPEGKIAISEGRVSLGNSSVGGLLCDLSIGDGVVRGKAGFRGFQGGSNALVELDASREDGAHQGGDSLRWQFRADISQETADMDAMARTLTNGALEGLDLDLFARGILDERGLTWRADVGRLSGRLFGMEFDQQSFGVVQGTPDAIELTLDIGMYDFYMETLYPISWLRVNGALPLDEAKMVDLGLTGTADLEQIRQLLAGISGESPDKVLSGFTPLGVGIMDLNVHGPYSDLGLVGTMQVRGGHLVPRDNFPYGIENLNVDLVFRDHSVALENLSGRMARGALSASGDATWNYKGMDGYRLWAKLDDFYYYFIPDGLHLSGSLDALFQSLPSGKSEIRGTLNATSMTYATEIDLRGLIPDASAGSIPSLQNVGLNDPLDSINLNLDVKLAQPWVIDTNFLKFRGVPSDNFKIMGTLANPGLRGRMDFIPGGRISNILPAGDVIIEKGSVDFPTPSVFNPVIDIQGQIDVSPYRVNINVQGALDSISMVPTSTPSLRQDEVISILLNPALASSIDGSATGRLSSQVATNSWASAASGLITNLALTSIQEQFRRTLKLDRMSVAWRPRVDSSAAAETDIIIGKNLVFGDRIVPLIGSYRTNGTVITVGSEAEWRIGNLVIRFGASGDGYQVAPSGEIRYSWSSR